MNFMNAVEKEINKAMTLTENGALAYASSGEKLLDFQFGTTMLRHSPEDVINDKITGVYFADSQSIVNRFFFWLRDCRYGNGERKIFRTYLKWLAKNKPEVCKAIIPLVPEYGRWDDLWCLLDTTLKDDVCELVRQRLETDIELLEAGRGISLLTKWIPSANTSSKGTRHYAEIIRKYLGLSPRAYRKTLSKMRNYLDVVEVKASANRWNEINYETVPSQANLKYKNAFERHDNERHQAYLESLKNGNAKINARVLQPHEIVGKYTLGGWRAKDYDETLEQLWKALPVKSLDSTLVVRDGSGSMTGGYGCKITPLVVATAFALYAADHNHGIWKSKFITFSANPKIVDISRCVSLHDKLITTYNEDDCSNTNIEKTMMLILKTAVNNRCSQEDMPKNVVIISDMGFDSCIGRGVDESLFDEIAHRFEDAGYKLPKIVFWNVAGDINNGIPMRENEMGVVLMSGFSIQLLDMVMSGETDPYKVLLDTINAPRYDAVEKSVKSVCNPSV